MSGDGYTWRTWLYDPPVGYSRVEIRRGAETSTRIVDPNVIDPHWNVMGVVWRPVYGTPPERVAEEPAYKPDTASASGCDDKGN